MNSDQTRISLMTITLVASLGGFLFGFAMAVISGVLSLVQEQFKLSAVQSGWFLSSALVGCIIGVMFSGGLTDRFGRKKLLILTSVLFVASALGCALLPSLSAVIMARVVGGIVIGIASSVVPLYILQVAPQDMRGKLVTYYQFALTFGILSGRPWPGHLSCGSLALDVRRRCTTGGTSFAGLLLIPESPRWLMQHHSNRLKTIGKPVKTTLPYLYINYIFKITEY